jgi:hypothetical protein
MSDFLPDGYEKPSTGGKYLKLQKGKNKFRILSSAIVGWLDWDKTAEKPTPVRTKEKPEKALNPNQGYKHFWAFVVWDYADSSIKIMEVTQATIQDSIIALSQDEQWGRPQNYDLIITKEGESLETKYTVMPSPPSEVSKEIIEAYVATPVNLEALFDNEDPFEVSKEETKEEELKNINF